jgi:hypothetical protein
MLFMVVGMESKAAHMLEKPSTVVLHPQPLCAFVICACACVIFFEAGSSYIAQAGP